MSDPPISCIAPPSPEVREKILRTKAAVQAGEMLPDEVTVDLLDLRSLTAIVGRPAKTRAHTFVSPVREQAPVVGTRRALVLLVDFSDKVASQTQQHYTDMLFSTATYPTGSLHDYYWEASYHQLSVTGAVSGQGGPTTGWYRAPQAYSYYVNGNNGFGTYPQNAQKLVEDAVDLADPYVNFADYDNDGDGVVDALFIVHAGPGAEATGNANDIWSHAWAISPKSVDGVTVQGYSMEPEDGRIGVFCHELGHRFGLPDLYDTDYSSAGVGTWDVMSFGSWNNGGNTPAHFGSWCKVKLGWVNPATIFNAQQSVTVTPYATNPSVYKLPVKNVNSKEYFLLENREQTGFDTNLPGAGLIILHVDENQTSNTDETHYLVDVVQADGNADLEKNANSGDATDPYPTGTNNALTATSTPNSKSYDGTDSLVSVTNIQRSGTNITANVQVGSGINVVPLYRYWNPGIGDHFYTTSWSELGGGWYGWNYEGIQCYVR